MKMFDTIHPSGQVARAGFEAGFLRVELKRGAVYEYGSRERAVEPEVARGLLEAFSPGGFFNTHIVGKYPYRKIV